MYLSENNAESEKKGSSRHINDNHQFTISLIIIVPFVSYIGLFHAFGLGSEAKEIMATLGAFVGTIVGFYFGQRPVQNLARQVSEAVSKNETGKKAVFDAQDRIESDGEYIDELNKKLDAQTKIINKLLSKNTEE